MRSTRTWIITPVLLIALLAFAAPSANAQTSGVHPTNIVDADSIVECSAFLLNYEPDPPYVSYDLFPDQCYFNQCYTWDFLHTICMIAGNVGQDVNDKWEGIVKKECWFLGVCPPIP